jgi:hypothetical protein
MFAKVSTILEVPVNKAACELDSENEAALLSKEGIMEAFKDVFVILVCCYRQRRQPAKTKTQELLDAQVELH